jgi:hypothetical protein
MRINTVRETSAVVFNITASVIVVVTRSVKR